MGKVKKMAYTMAGVIGILLLGVASSSTNRVQAMSSDAIFQTSNTYVAVMDEERHPWTNCDYAKDGDTLECIDEAAEDKCVDAVGKSMGWVILHIVVGVYVVASLVVFIILAVRHFGKKQSKRRK